jgi:hypothetical protein
VPSHLKVPGGDDSSAGSFVICTSFFFVVEHEWSKTMSGMNVAA